VKALYAALCWLTLVPSVGAQDLVIANARIIVANGTVIENGSIVVQLSTVGFGVPVFGVFANDNTPRFRDGKPWPESSLDGYWNFLNPKVVVKGGVIVSDRR